MYLATGDCTGHGIPGALMSMMAHTALYSALYQQSDSLGVLLTDLDSMIRKNLHQSADGMDMSICSFDTDTGELRFAGALRPLVIMRGNQLQRIKGDRSGIGGRSKGFEFKEVIVDAQPGDVVYMFSDGFSDQFGGENGRKYMSKRFDKFLESIQDHCLEEQQLLLQYEFHLWKEQEEQVDDVIVMAFRIPERNNEFRLSA